MKKILFLGAEVMPFAATGGLGDVMGSLPAALAREKDNDVRVMMPLYGQIKDEWRAKMKDVAVFSVQLAWRNLYCGIKSLKKDGVTYYFIDNEYYFKRDKLYGEYDDGERFAYFCMAAMESLAVLDFFPDILHAHDWQAALAVVYRSTLFAARAGYENIRTVFTIHNIEYQGKYHFGIMEDVFGLGLEEYSRMEYDGCINLMKAAIVSANRVSTVSPRYAEEICTAEYSHGLAPILQANKDKLCGILNGIDDVYYNPGTDRAIATRYNWRTRSKKVENKCALQTEVSLPVRANVPMFALISRLAAHKGVDLIAEMIADFVAGHDVQLVILGCGEERYEYFFRELERRFPDKVRALICYDRDLSKRIYAAADLFLMPSKSEPCGLSQMIASRYGAIPIVRETGGLFDSIKGYWVEDGEVRGNGFTFANYDSRELLDRCEAALALYQDGAAFDKLLQKVMRMNFSWGTSAACYLKLYHDTCASPIGG